MILTRRGRCCYFLPSPPHIREGGVGTREGGRSRNGVRGLVSAVGGLGVGGVCAGRFCGQRSVGGNRVTRVAATRILRIAIA